MRHRFSALMMVLIVAGGVGVFVALPIGAVLKASFETPRPLSLAELVKATEAVLVFLPADERAERLVGWWERARLEEQVDTTRTALQLEGLPVGWRTNERYDVQAEAAAAALAGLPSAERAAVEAQLPLVNAALHKRVLIATIVKDTLPTSEVEAFRAGVVPGLGLANYTALLIDPRLQRAARNSLALAATTATGVTFLAFALAYGVQRARIPGAPVVRAVVLLPLVSPPVLVAFATLLLFGRQGLVTKTLFDDTLGLIDAHTTNIYGFWGVVIAQLIGLLPAAYIIVDNALSRQDASLEEAAVSSGAAFRQVLRHVTLPLAAPGLARAFIVAFVLSMTDFGNPGVIGQGFPVLAGEIYDLIVGQRAFPLAAALCVWLLVPGLGLYLLAERAFRRPRYDAGLRASAGFSVAVPAAVGRMLTAIAIATTGLIALVFAVVVASAFTVYWGVDYGFTLAHFRGERVDEAFAGTGFGTRYLGLDAVWVSLQVAFVAAPLGGCFALLAAYTLDRLRPPGHVFLGFLALLPAVLPGIIFGIGYLVAFNNPFGRPELALTGTLAILVINVMFGNLFVGVLAGRTVLQKVAGGIEDAARTLGAGAWQRFRHVLLPLMRQAFLLGALYVFIDALTTLSSVIFLVSGRHMLASVLIFNQASGVEYGSAAAKSVAILAIVLAVVAIAFLVERRFARLVGERPRRRA
ncbi:MAG: iron ABC transporter permease [Pseudomonadota bacterium]